MNRYTASVLFSLTLLTGCGSAAIESMPTTTAGPPTTAATTASVASAKADDGTEFCSIFQGLSERKQAKGDGFERYEDEAAWTAGVKNVEHIAAVAPEAIKSQAETYIQMMKDRQGLAASYNYEPVPQDAKMQFGRAHAAMQQQVNQLIAYAKANCTGVA